MAGRILETDSGGILGTPVVSLPGTACDKSCWSGLAKTKGPFPGTSKWGGTPPGVCTVIIIPQTGHDNVRTG